MRLSTTPIIGTSRCMYSEAFIARQRSGLRTVRFQFFALDYDAAWWPTHTLS